jgi:hypothetical protein
MNIKRSYFHVLLASLTVGLLLTNCTIKSVEDDGSCTKGKRHNGCDCGSGIVGYQVCGSDGTYGDCVCGKGPATDDTCTKGDKVSGCSCAGSVVGYQVCDAEGVYGSCVCPSGGGDGGSGGTQASLTAGTGGVSSSTSGSSSGGSSGSSVASANDGGAGGEGGTPQLDPEDCEACLAALCKTELDACLDDPQCISADADGSGQYERISNCINAERVNGLVTRDKVRGCGVTIGASSDPDLISDWAPEGMAPATTNLLNCMGTSSSQTPNADWANSDANFPVDGQGMINPTPWPSDSCAKLSCTSKFK